MVHRRLDQGGVVDVVVPQVNVAEELAGIELSADRRDRVAGRLGDKGGHPVEVGAVLDDVELIVVRVQGKLDVVDADNPQLPGDRKGGVPHVLNLPVQQGLGRVEGHRVPGMNADRVHVLDHRKHHHRPRGVALDHHLNFLVAGQALLNQDLFGPRLTEAALDRRRQFPLVVDDPPGTVALWQNGADDHRVAQLLGLLQGVLVVADRDHRLHRRVHLVEGPTEQDRVVHLAHRRLGNPEQLDVTLLNDSLLEEFLGQLEGVLVADRRQDGVGVVTLDQLHQVLNVQRPDAGVVDRRPVLQADRERVVVGQDGLDAELLEGRGDLEGCRIQLVTVLDVVGPGPDHQDRLDGLFRHQCRASFRFMMSRNSSNRPSVSSGPGAPSGKNWTEKAG